MVLKTLESMGQLHAMGLRAALSRRAGPADCPIRTLYPALLRLEQEGYIVSEWGVSDNNRRARFYKLTRAGHRQVEKESQRWEKATAIVARFVSPARTLMRKLRAWLLRLWDYPIGIFRIESLQRRLKRIYRCISRTICAPVWRQSRRVESDP